MMIGIPGSGKTTIAKRLQESLNAIIISSDVVRSHHPDWKEECIFPEVYRQIAKNLNSGSNVIFDATNIDCQTRAKHLRAIRAFISSFRLVAYVILADPDICIKRIILRNEKKVELFLPPEVTLFYHHKLVHPALEEGFDDIITIQNDI